MRRPSRWIPAFIMAVALIGLAVPAAQAGVPLQDDAPDEALIERGAYLAQLAGCIDCHTPVDEREELIAGRELSGGRAFQLGELGVVLSPNITQDEETGIGSWTDEEIAVSIKTGASPGGYQNFPVMPYPAYAGMAEPDVQAIVAYLRTVDPIENEVPREQVLPTEAMPNIPYIEVAEAPDASNPAARGEYLIDHVFACGDCHTPADPATGEPIEALYLAGGRPFEGPWGIVYGGNITPHEETGIGTWSEEAIERAIVEGVRPDGRVLVLMPAEENYAPMTDGDLASVITYMTEVVEPVDNEVPAPSLNEDFVQFVESDAPAEDEEDGAVGNAVLIVMGVILVLAAGAAGMFLGRSQGGSGEGG